MIIAAPSVASRVSDRGTLHESVAKPGRPLAAEPQPLAFGMAVQNEAEAPAAVVAAVADSAASQPTAGGAEASATVSAVAAGTMPATDIAALTLPSPSSIRPVLATALEIRAVAADPSSAIDAARTAVRRLAGTPRQLAAGDGAAMLVAIVSGDRRYRLADEIGRIPGVTDIRLSNLAADAVSLEVASAMFMPSVTWYVSPQSTQAGAADLQPAGLGDCVSQPANDTPEIPVRIVFRTAGASR